MSGAGNFDQAQKMMKEFAPFGDMGMKLFQQFSSLATDAATRSTGSKKAGGKD